MKTENFSPSNIDAEKAFVSKYPNRKGLLESLCIANNCQGGTIHQFVNVSAPNYDRFVNEFKTFCIDMSFVCNTKNGFKKLAKRVSFEGLLF